MDSKYVVTVFNFSTSNVNTLNATEHVQNVASSYLNFSTLSISKPLALGVDPKIKANIWAQSDS
jgi:hypothetical protein